MRLTLADIRNSRIPKILGVCPADDRVPQFTNEAVQRLLPKGHWWGSYGRFRICATDGCLTFPPQIAALERAAVCGGPVNVRDMWYEFLENGFGIQYSLTGSSGSGSSGGCCGGNVAPWPGSFGMGDALQRGTFPTFRDVQGTNKKLTLVCDLVSDVGKEVLVLGYDENNNWIRTSQGGLILDGEVIALAQAGGTTSVNKFTVVTDIQPPDDLDGQWWLYEYNVDTALLTMLGHYQYFETRPNYQRYFFPMIGSGTDSEDECILTTVEVIAKLDFIPVVRDTDYVVLGCFPAIKEMVRAIFLSENEPDYEKSARILATGEALALKELDRELEHYLGQRRIGVDIVGASVGSAQPIEALL